MALTPEQSEMYAQFAWEFQSCWACGIDPSRQICRHWPARCLQNAHILGGPSRTADRRNILRLCLLCHNLAHGHTIRDKDRNPLPNLTRENLLWLKESRDPKYFDLDYLNSISIRLMKEPEPVPFWFEAQYERWRA